MTPKRGNCKSTRSLPVHWTSCSWNPAVTLSDSSSLAKASENLKIHNRITGAICERTDISFSALSEKPNPSVNAIKNCSKGKYMNHAATRPQSRGFTLIELLVVISIIGVLASMILPALSKAKQKAQIAKCRTEITDLAGAISAYQSAYNGRLPASKEVRAAVNDANPDFTYGDTLPNGALVPGMKLQKKPIGSALNRNNSEVITILKDLTQFRSNGQPTANANHALNPEKTVFLNARDVEGTSPGVGPDGIYRDPWGNPYIISLDLNYNEQTRDAMYSIGAVSRDPSVTTGTAGLNGTSKADASANSYEVRASVLVWSFGPDMQADPTIPANQGVNKDNILSWK